MKKLLLFIAILFVAMGTIAQDVTKFLGIPVDGYKSDMIKKLAAKGFVYNSTRDCMLGEFNGEKVSITIQTVNNKVWRLIVADESNRSESSIRIRYNNLCSQFDKNERYTSQASLVYKDNYIPEDTDISYEMSVNNKQFQAIYYQNPNNADIDAVTQTCINNLKKKFPNIDYNTPTSEIDEDIIAAILEEMINYMSNKTVWFTIFNNYEDYYLVIYYENEYNAANGDDL